MCIKRCKRLLKDIREKALFKDSLAVILKGKILL